jgi:hypothetical protein
MLLAARLAIKYLSFASRASEVKSIAQLRVVQLDILMRESWRDKDTNKQLKQN